MFLDTSGLLCLHDKGDARHAKAKEVFDVVSEALTHNYVLAEFLPLCQSRGKNRREAVLFSWRLDE